MATSNINAAKTGIKQLKASEKKLSGALRSSSTAMGNAAPTSYDVEKQRQLMALTEKRKAAEDQLIKDRWYGSDKPTSGGEEKKGYFARGLEALGAPVYAQVGAIESLTGKGSKPGMWENIKANVKEHEGYGSLMKKSGVPNMVAAPVGFAMDIAMDPLNWITGGATALIPRVGRGLLKGGLKGAAKGVASSGLGKAAAMVAEKTPMLNKVGAVSKFAKESLTGVAKQEYDILIGRDIGEVLNKIENRKFISKGYEAFRATPLGQKVEKVIKPILPDSGYMARSKALEDEAAAQIVKGTRITGTPEEIASAVQARTGISPFDEMMDLSRTIKNEGPEAYNRKLIGKDIDEAIDLSGKYSLLGKSADYDGVASAMAGEAEINSIWKGQAANVAKKMQAMDEEKVGLAVEKVGENVKRASQTLLEGTGIKSWDNWIKNIKENYKIKDIEVGRHIVETFDKMAGLFKTAKVPLNPGSHVYAFFGNHVIGALSGINTFGKTYIKDVADSYLLINGLKKKGSATKFINDLILENDEFAKVVAKYPESFKRVFGMHPSYFKSSASSMVEAAFKNAKDAGMISSYSKDDLIKAMKIIDAEGGGVFFKGKMKGPQGVFSRMAEEGNRADITSSLFSSEFGGAYGKMVDNIGKKGEAGNKLAKILHWSMTKPGDMFASTDQSHKLASFIRMTSPKRGITERELITLARNTRGGISKSDIVQQIGDRYILKGEKAMDIAADAYMNYGAMPSAVKLLRSMPIMGGPFVSFQYGMASKAAKSLSTDPAIFNKINFFLNEMQGEKSPIEKERLKEPYYSWFNKEGMVKLPFFNDNPVYANLMNYLPYYSLNMFTPSQRTYEDVLPSTLSQIIEKTPFFQTPEGQVMMDYFVVPLILRESNPVNRFGQPIWPEGASTGEKLGYALRQEAEAYVPGVAGFAGLVGGKVAPGIEEYVPSYNYRKLSYAVQGKGTKGLTTKTDATKKTIMSVLSSLGIPLYDMNLDYKTESEK